MEFFTSESFRLLHDDILTTQAIGPASVDLIVTSPPYNVDIQYNSHKDDSDYTSYLDFSLAWLSKAFSLARSEGRLCLNVPLDKNKGGQQSVAADMTALAKQAGWKYHSTIIWNEQNISRRTAWGSWMKASAPYVIAPVEVILVLYKDEWRRDATDRVSDIKRDEFIAWTNGMWTFSGESKKRVGHPAPFPIELPYRCIKLFSFVDDTVLDPFLGSGTTAIAALQNHRRMIGVELDKKYCQLALERVEENLGSNTPTRRKSQPRKK
jgi:site-specific DNA-methyltransferase (adenine-specific)